MAARETDLKSALCLLEILRVIPKKPNSISSTAIYQHLLSLGFNKDKRSFHRYLKELCEHFEDLECNDDSKPYHYAWLERSQGLSVPLLTEQQSLLLKLAEQQLKYLLPANIMSSMKSFFSQAESNLIYGSHKKMTKQWLNKVCSVPSSLLLIPAKVKETIFSSVSEALYQNRWLKIEYKNQNGKTHQATIMPLAIAQQSASIYLVCRYEGFDDERLLALHRIQKAEISTFTFERPADFDLQAYQEEGNLGFSNQGKIRLSFSITKSAGFHLTETPLTKDQIILEETDKHYRFQAIVADNDMLEWWLRKFGEDIWAVEKEPI